MWTDKMLGRYAAAVVTIILIIMSTTLLFKGHEPIEPIENLPSVLDKLSLTYYRQNSDCKAVEEKVTFVKSQSDPGPGRMDKVVTLVDVVANYGYKFETGETGAFPWRPILTCKEPDDRMVVDHVRTMIHHGFGQEKGSTLKQSKRVKDSLSLQMLIHKKYLRKEQGYFLEYRSNPEELVPKTFYLEKNENWTGLLLDPVRFINISTNPYLSTYRNVDYMTGCLAENRKSHWKIYSRDELLAPEKMVHKDYNKLQFANAKSQCYNLESILLALNRNSLDLLVLNGYGSELAILEHIPFHKFNIAAFMIQMSGFSGFNGLTSEENRMKVRQLLLNRGYEEKRVDADDSADNLLLFLKKEKEP